MGTITKLFKRLTNRDRHFNPDQYWETRHKNLAGSLRAVGHLNLTDAENANQYATKANHLLDILVEIAPDPANCKLLDAGCGTGQLTQHFANAGYQTTGVDFSKTAITQARQNVPTADFHVSPLPTLDLPDRPYDIITVVDVLMHLVNEDDWQASLRTLANHLTPTGHLLIMDYFPESPETNPNHFNPRPLAQYKSALKPLNLIIVAQSRIHLLREDVTKHILVVGHSRPT